MIVEEIQRYIQENYEDKKKKIGYYYPSQIPYCLRKQYWDYIDPLPPSEESINVFFLGNLIHEAVEKILGEKISGKSEKQLLIPVDLRQGIFITGRADLVLENDEDEITVVEIKTTNSLVYKDKDGFKEKNEPSEHHIVQIMPYLYAFNAKQGIIVYIDRQRMKMKEFVVHRDWRMMEKIFERVRKLHEHIVKKKLPPPESMKDPRRRWECGYCQYKFRCYTDVLK